MELTDEQQEQLDEMFWSLIDQGATATDAERTIAAFVGTLAAARREETGEENF